MTRFRLDVTLALQLTLDGDTADEVIGRARDIVGARPGVRSESISSICAMPIPTAHPTMQASNLTYWQESEAIEHGTATQRWQWERGELPAAELADIARSVLFAPLAGFKRRVRMGPSAIKHPTDETGGMDVCHRTGDVSCHRPAWRAGAGADRLDDRAVFRVGELGAGGYDAAHRQRSSDRRPPMDPTCQRGRVHHGPHQQGNLRAVRPDRGGDVGAGHRACGLVASSAGSTRCEIHPPHARRLGSPAPQRSPRTKPD